MRTITIMLLVLVFTAMAYTVWMQPAEADSQDVMTVSSNPDANYGQEGIFWVSSTNEHSSGTASFIRFEELKYFMGRSCKTAVLHLYGWVEGTQPGEQFMIGPVSTSWDEDILTWNNMPGVFESRFLAYPPSFGWFTIDVTDFVRKWLDGTYSNNGLALFDNDGYDENASFESGEMYTQTGCAPKLYLEF